jgi:hypothetical protein
MLRIWAIISANWLQQTQNTKTEPFVVSTAMLQESPHKRDHHVWIKQVIGAIWTCHRLARLGGTKINNGIERPEEKALFSSRPDKANPRSS